VTRTPQQPMHISEQELLAMTRELDDLHQETFPGVRNTMDEFTANLVRNTRASRRSLLVGTVGLVGLGALAACGKDDKDTAAMPSASGSVYTGDLRVVALAAALENLAVAAYDGALKRATSGQLGTVPPAIGTFIQRAVCELSVVRHRSMS
jgi:hypothetical protein